MATGVLLFLADDTDETVSVADEHWNKAIDYHEAGMNLVNEYYESKAETTSAAAEEQLEKATAEVSAARSAIEELDDSEGRTSYLKALDSASEAIDAIEDMLGAATAYNELSTEIDAAWEKVDAADDLADDAISAGNAENYSKMKTKASSASRTFAQALSMFTALDKKAPKGGFDSSIQYVRLHKQRADLEVKMAGYGKAGSTSKYNSAIDKFNALNDKIDALAEKVNNEDNDWMFERLEEASDTSDKAGEKANQLHDEAIEQFGV